MGHNHSHNNVTGNIAAAFFLNSFFAVIELVGGILTNSIAILSDALHDFGDCLSLGVAWGLQKKSTQGRDNLYSYGYKRFSLLGTIFLSGVLTVSSAFVVVEAVKRLFAPQQVSPEGMLWMAVFGVIINGAAALKLKKGDSLSERAVFLHIMEDVLGWMAVLVVSVVMLFIDLPILDPLLSIAITIWVLSNVYKNMRQTIKILMQAVPIGMDIQALQNDIEAIDGVESLHDLHVWTLDGTSHIMTLHVATTAPTQPLKDAIFNLAEHYDIKHITIEFETHGDICRCNCDK